MATTLPAPADAAVAPDRAALLAAARAAMDAKTKPLGALGRLEALAVRLAVLQGTTAPVAERLRTCVFAADHGVAAEGVSAYPAAVTREMLRTFARGDAAVCVLAAAGGVEVEVVDVGVDADPVPGVVDAKVRRGSRNLVREPAMTDAELDAALAAGRAAAARAADAGVRALGLGEMGIGNTTSAAALLSALTGRAAADTVGRGTGVDDATLARKRRVVDDALDRHAAAIHGTGFGTPDARAALRCVGGLELAAIVGAAGEAAARGLVVVADGFISTVAVLAAAHLALAEGGTLLPALVVAHHSAEQGHGVALDALGTLADAVRDPVDAALADVRPLLALDMRLGEGSGAALALPLVRAAARLLRDMATFASAGVPGAVDAGGGAA